MDARNLKLMKMEENNRICFACIHMSVCSLANHLTGNNRTVRFNIDGDAAPGKYIDVFKAIANACLDFKTEMKNENDKKNINAPT
jgi:hypothetical protein